MSSLVLLGVAVAGGFGAVLRWLVDVLTARKLRGGFPWGIFLVNVSGSFVLGLLTGLLAAGDPTLTVLGTGFLGGYTTFSSVAATSAVMLDNGDRREAAANVVGTFVVSVAAAALGLLLGGFRG